MTFLQLASRIQSARSNQNRLPTLEDFGTLRELNKDDLTYATCRMTQGGQGHMAFMAKLFMANADSRDGFRLIINVNNPNLANFIAVALLPDVPDVTISLIQDPAPATK